MESVSVEYLSNPQARIAIIGRPNVGKSTLFNRMVGKRVAIVEDYEGVTRDWQAFQGSLFDLSFTILDTPGLGLKDSVYDKDIHDNLKGVIAQCDGVIFMVDGKFGVHALDQQTLTWLRKQGKPMIFVANKCERYEDTLKAFDTSQLGLGSPIIISALQGHGMWELKEAISQLTPSLREAPKASEPGQSIRVAVMGRPNAGKSTFINTCLGSMRLLTGPEAGVTRDAIEVPMSLDGQDFIFIDTAGFRKQARVEHTLEQLSRYSGKRALIFSHVTLLCVDGTRGLEKQDLTLLESILEEGRAVVIGLSKCDQVSDKKAYMKGLRHCLDESIALGKWIPLVPFSSLTQEGVSTLCHEIKTLYQRWNQRIGTGPLNRWFMQSLQDNQPPLVRGRAVKPKYIAQIKSRPPTFVVFGNQMEHLPENYRKYLLNRLVEHFKFQGANPRITYKNSINPYDHAS
jgi:GTP-binding protein